MLSSSLGRCTRHGAVATVVAGTALALVGQDLFGATPARASLTGAGVDKGEHVTVWHDADSVVVSGHPEGTPLVVEVLRRDLATGEDLSSAGRAGRLGGSSVTLRSATVPAELRIDPGTASVVLEPTTDLAPDTRYTVSVTTAVRDAAGNRFPGTSSTFTTAAGPDVARSAVTGR